MTRRWFDGAFGGRLVEAVMDALNVNDTQDIIIDAPFCKSENLFPHFHGSFEKEPSIGLDFVKVQFDDGHCWHLSDFNLEITSKEKDRIYFYIDGRPFIAYKAG